MNKNATKPNWDRLYEIVTAHEGYFTTFQAAEVGYSPQLLAKYVRNGRITRVRRGIYRMIHFPAGEHENLSVLWLWSEQAGVLGFETALALHELSEILPASVHMILPQSWTRRRLRIPSGVVLHHADLEDADRTWCGSIPVTTPARTLRDCAAANVAPDLVRQALDEGLDRGQFTKSEVVTALEYVAQFEGGAS